MCCVVCCIACIAFLFLFFLVRTGSESFSGFMSAASNVGGLMGDANVDQIMDVRGLSELTQNIEDNPEVCKAIQDYMLGAVSNKQGVWRCN